MTTQPTATFGLIAGNRDVFPRALAKKGKQVVMAKLKELGMDVVTVSIDDTEDGVIETASDAERCAEVFKKKAAFIDGIFITLPNFGDERAIADAVKTSGLQVPVFVHAFPDRLEDLSISARRDSFCGKLSVCNNLKQYGITYSLRLNHVTDPDSEEFAREALWFARVCRVTRGLRAAKIGSLGARTTQFKTVRFSEKLLELSGISVETKSLMETVQQINALDDADQRVKQRLTSLREYSPDSASAPDKAFITSAKLSVVLEQWVTECRLDAYAIQCWPAMQDAITIFPCAVMSQMSTNLIPAACEMDVMGAVAMYALQLAGGEPSAVFDWNNNYGNDPDTLILFHCSNCPISLMKDARTGYNVIAAKFRDAEETYTTFHGNLKAGKVTFARFSTDDEHGEVACCIGSGTIADEIPDSFGTTGVLTIGSLPRLLYFLADNGFEHHVALNYGADIDALYEALTRYMGWKVYFHGGDNHIRPYDW